MRDIFNSNLTILFQNSSKNFEDLLADISKFAAQNNHDEIEIFTQDSYLFLIAFFGSILSNSKPYLLSYNIPSGSRAFYDDEAVLKTLSSSTKSTNTKLNPLSTFYIQTSGSTAESKNIEKSIDQMIKEGQFLSSFFKFNSDHIFISSVSHQHLFGLTFNIFTALISGSKISAQVLRYPEILVKELDNYNKDDKIILISSPVLLDSLSKQKNIAEFDKIKSIFTAGSKLSKDIKTSIESRLNLDITEIYGSSETGVIAQSKGDDFTPFPSVQISSDEESRLIVKSPWQNSKDGFISNDCVQIDGDNLKILGRYDRIIKLHDRRVSLDEIENLIKQSPFINKVSIAQDERYKRLAAILVLSDEGKKLYKTKGKKGVVANINELISHKYNNKLRYFYIRSSLSINAQGKIPKKDFLASIEENIEPKFNLISKESNLIKLSAYIDEGCFYFNGHFLNFPLVPGFIQLGFVFNAAKEHLGLEYSKINQIESIKFMSFLRPCDMANLEIKIINNKLYFTLFANDKECANGRLNILQ